LAASDLTKGRFDTTDARRGTDRGKQQRTVQGDPRDAALKKIGPRRGQPKSSAGMPAGTNLPTPNSGD
jgi:hypothetical protein